MVLGATAKGFGPDWCRGVPEVGQSQGTPWDPLCPPASPPRTRSSLGIPALSRDGGVQLNIKVGGARLIIGNGGAQLIIRVGGARLIIGVGGPQSIIRVGGVQLIIRIGGAQLIISRRHCYSSGSSEGGSALWSGSISVLISTRRGEETWLFLCFNIFQPSPGHCCRHRLLGSSNTPRRGCGRRS